METQEQPAESHFKIRLSKRERECLDYIVFKYRAKSRTSAVKACIRMMANHLGFELDPS